MYEIIESFSNYICDTAFFRAFASILWLYTAHITNVIMPYTYLQKKMGTHILENCRFTIYNPVDTDYL